MKLKFWGKPKVRSLDYGRIEDVAVAWDLAREVETNRVSNLEWAKNRLAAYLNAQFRAVMFDDQMGVFTPKIEEKIADLQKLIDDSFESKRKAVRETPAPDGGRAIVQVQPWGSHTTPCLKLSIDNDDTRNYHVQFRPCKLAHGHEGPHQRVDGGEWVDILDHPSPIIVFEDFTFDMSDGEPIQIKIDNIEQNFENERNSLKRSQEQKLKRLRKALGLSE